MDDCHTVDFCSSCDILHNEIRPFLNEINYVQMTKKKEREYAKDRQEYFREFHRVIAPVVVMKKYDE